MKKPILAPIIFLFVVAAMLPVYAQVGITSKTWLGTIYTGYDDYYDADVNAYKAETTAVLKVTVTNEEGLAINITKVYVNFDWDSTYTSTQVSSTNPETLEDNEVRVFFIDFRVPNTTVASNLYTHSYNIVAEFSHPNASNPFQILQGKYHLFDDDFAVYSEDQASATDLKRIVESFIGADIDWTSARAKILWNRVMNETLSGYKYYGEGNFYKAKQRFGTALDYIDQAWDAEETYLTVQEDLQIRHTEASIRNLDAMANFYNGMSTMWVLFGLGGVLFGLGYIIKWIAHMRMRSKTEAST